MERVDGEKLTFLFRGCAEETGFKAAAEHATADPSRVR